MIETGIVLGCTADQPWRDQHAQQKAIRLFGDARMRAFARSGHIEHPDAMCFDPPLDFHRIRILLQIDYQAWFGVMLREAVREVRTAGRAARDRE